MYRTERNAISRYQAAIITGAPVVMLASFVYHPFLAALTNSDAVASAAKADPLRWGLAHVAVAVGSGLMVLAFIAVRAFLSDAGEDRHSGRALPWVAFGGVLYAVLPGIELGAMAGMQGGADFARMERMLNPWFIPILLTGATANAIGLLLFAKAFRASRVLGAGATQTGLVATALVIMAVSRFVPLGVVQFYVQGAAGILALWPVARAMRAGVAPSSVDHARPAAAM
jgi:hypothetical protein